MGRRRYLPVLVLLSIALVVVLAACTSEEELSPTTPPLPTPDVPATVVAAVLDTLPTLAPTPDVLATIEVRPTPTGRPTPTPPPTSTPYPTPTPRPTATPTPRPTATPTPRPTATPTPRPTATPTPRPTATPTPRPTATPTPRPTATPTPTPTPVSDAHLSVVLDATGGQAIGEGELRIDFTVTNEAAAPAFGVTLAFGVSQPSRLVIARGSRGACEASTCDLGSVEGHESVTGHVVVLAKLTFDAVVSLDADVSWLLRNSNRRHSYAQVNVPFSDSHPGALIWITSTNASAMSCGDSVQVGPEAVYTGFGGKLYAVSRSSGEVLWFNDGNNWIFQPLLADGSIYFHASEWETNDSYVRSLDSSSGTLDWQHKVEGNVQSPVVVHGGSVYFTQNEWTVEGQSEYSSLVSLDAWTGVPNWQYRVDKWINTPAVEFGGNIFFGTYYGDAYLYSIDPDSGELNRRYRTEGGSYWTPPIADDTAYVSSGYYSLYAIDLSTGRKTWEYLPGSQGARMPVFSDGKIYFRLYDEGAEDYFTMQALDAATGNLLWEYKPGNALLQPTVYNGSVYVPSYGGLVSLDAVTGSPNWQASYSRICGPLTAVDGILYGRASSDKGFIVFAIRAREAQPGRN